MEGGRKVNDRNLVVFGIPDVPVEREIAYIKDELQRRTVVADSPRPSTPAPTPTVTPAPAPLVVNGLLTNPQLHMQSYAYTGDWFDNMASMGVDVDDELGYGAGTIWFLSLGSVGTGSSFAGGPASYSLCYFDPASLTATKVLDSVRFVLFNGYADSRRFFFANNKITLSESPNLDASMQVFDPALPDWGCSVDMFGVATAPQTAPKPSFTSAYYTTDLSIGGTKYVLSSDGYAYNPTTDSWSLILGPNGTTAATDYVSGGAFMWCRHNFDLYSAPASLTPTWSLRNTDNVPLSTDEVAVMPNTGELIVAYNGATAPGLRRGFRSYDFTTGTRTERAGVFSAAGLPSTAPQFAGTADVEPNLHQLTVRCGNNMVVITGSIRSDSLGTTIPPSNSFPSDKMWVRAVWVLKGSGSGLATSAIRLTQTDVASWPAFSPGAATSDNHPYSSFAIAGPKVYTWVGGTLVQADGSLPPVNLTIQVESWIREHTP